MSRKLNKPSEDDPPLMATGPSDALHGQAVLKMPATYPLELVAQIAASLAATRPLSEAATDAIELIGACERAIKEANSPHETPGSASTFLSAALAEWRDNGDGLPQDFDKSVRTITGEEKTEDAYAMFRKFLRYEAEKRYENNHRAESLSCVVPRSPGEIESTLGDESLKTFETYKSEGLGGRRLQAVQRDYTKWYQEVFRGVVVRKTNRENGQKGGRPRKVRPE